MTILIPTEERTFGEVTSDLIDPRNGHVVREGRCLVWQDASGLWQRLNDDGQLSADTYGAVVTGKSVTRTRKVRAHRVAAFYGASEFEAMRSYPWEDAIDLIQVLGGNESGEKRVDARHLCGRKMCVNPSCVTLGSPQSNTLDGAGLIEAGRAVVRRNREDERSRSEMRGSPFPALHAAVIVAAGGTESEAALEVGFGHGAKAVRAMQMAIASLRRRMDEGGPFSDGGETLGRKLAADYRTRRDPNLNLDLGG